MRGKFRLRAPSPALAVSLVALVMALGGTSYAAFTLPNNSVGTKQLKNGAVTTPKLKNGAVTASKLNTTGVTVPNALQANSLTPLPSGQSESGAFSGGGGTSTSGWFGFDVTYPRALATAIANNHIIDTTATPDPTHCPGPGKAAAGYLCLYFQYHSNVGTVYGYSTNYPYSAVSPSVGVGFYAPITGTFSYANGVWTVTAP